MKRRITAGRRRPLSRRTRPFQESVIREMTRLHAEVGGVNLAQGLPDFDPPPELIGALEKAIRRSENHQYGFTWGVREFRRAIAEKSARFNGISADPETEVTVTCGVSEGVAAAVLALTEPGDEVLILEPWYENYLPACVLAGVRPRFVSLARPDFRLDPKALEGAIRPATRLATKMMTTPATVRARLPRATASSGSPPSLRAPRPRAR